MISQEMIEKVAGEVLEQVLRERQQLNQTQTDIDEDIIMDITSPEIRNEILISKPKNLKALELMKEKTIARIGIGSSGARLNTNTLLTLRADHARAKDAVLLDVDEGMLDNLGLFSVQTLCEDKDEHLTRPDLGRQFSEETLNIIKEKCKLNPQVQILISDGLSSTGIKENIKSILPVLMEGLEKNGVDVGEPFFIKYGRVPSMDAISDALNSEVTCILIGERPGLATAESMSAYICYKATKGISESKRTVVSNIHRGGIPAVEAGAYIVDILGKMLKEKASGVDLKLEGDQS